MTVTVIIPCFNHATYLAAAIESALTQSDADVDVIVIDDGSTDGSAGVAARYEDVRLIRQPNRGLAAARNAGIETSGGDVLIFLDADDRLFPNAARAAIDALERNPDAAMAFGRCQLIDALGRSLPTNLPRVTGHFYEELLRRNYIWTPAMAAYRRGVFAMVGGFDSKWSPAADYEMHLRITRRFPVVAHDALVAEYRQHGSNMSGDPVMMLDTTLDVMRAQRRFVRANPAWRRAHREGIRQWRQFYGERLVARFRAAIRTTGATADAVWCARQLLRWYPAGVAYHLWRKATSGRLGQLRT